MSVVEELVARIGIEAKGIPELKKLDGALKKAQGGLSAFGDAMNKSLGSGQKLTALNNIKAGLPAIASQLKSSTALASGLGGIFAAVAMKIGGAVVKLGAFVAAMALARLHAAKLRREAQWDAEGKRTTAGGVDKLKSRLGGIGVTDDEATTLHSGIAEKVNEAISKGDTSEFKKIGVDVLDKRHRQRDTADITEEIVAKYLARQQKAKALRQQEQAALDKKQMKKADALRAQADAIEKPNREIAKNFGLDPILGKLRSTSPEDMKRKAEDSARKAPPPSAEKEKQLATNAEEFRKLSESVGAGINGLLRPFQNFADAVNSIALPKLNKWADATIGAMKSAGLIDKTPDEQNEEAERGRESRRGAARMGQEAGAVARWSKLADALEKQGAGQGTFAALFGNEKDKFVLAMRAYQQAQERERRASTSGDGTAANLMPQFVESTKRAFEAVVDAAKKLQDVQATNAATVKGEGAKAEKAQVKEDRRTYSDIGNDKRTITNSVTVNATGLDEVAAKVKAAVLGAISTKAANTSTGALSAP